jgi:hypothetical protein
MEKIYQDNSNNKIKWNNNSDLLQNNNLKPNLDTQDFIRLLEVPSIYEPLHKRLENDFIKMHPSKKMVIDITANIIPQEIQSQPDTNKFIKSISEKSSCNPLSQRKKNIYYVINLDNNKKRKNTKKKKTLNNTKHTLKSKKNIKRIRNTLKNSMNNNMLLDYYKHVNNNTPYKL